MTTVYLWPAWALLNLAAFAGGALLPIATVSHFYLFDNEVVLATVPIVLAENGERLLAITVFLLGIVLPIAKTLVYVAAPYWRRAAVLAGRFAPIAFFDIFMIALLIFVAKGAFAADAATAVGIYPLIFFACSSKLIEWAFVRSNPPNDED